MATTTNYGWTTPDDTALVKDGASAIRTLGSSVDTTTKALNPSTTLGDIEYRSSTANTNTRVGIGSSGQALTVVAGVPSWAASATSVLTTTGDTLYASGANTLARRAIGSTGDVLTVSGGVPTWAAPAGGGGMTLISTTTLTGASVSLTSIPSTYNNLQIVIRNYLPASDAQSIRMTVNSTSSIYRTPNTLPEPQNQSAGSTYIINGDADNAVSTGTSIVTIFDYANTDTIKLSTIVSAVNNSTTTANFNLKFNMGIIGTTSAISSLQFVNDSGNFTSGTVLLYGVK